MRAQDNDKKIKVGIYMDPELHRRLKIEAASIGESITDVISNLVEGWLQGDGFSRDPHADGVAPKDTKPKPRKRGSR
ncbi:plasmid partition protein ParG [Bradyrhizobium elkanii]|uniref:plasmid partition protein ParG n=1 Tax=Bradyrhizobium elkanii TaxID=29448 RepID=UPI0035163F58